MTADYPLRSAREADVEQILLVHVAAIIAHGPTAYTDRQVAAWAAKTEGVDRYVNAIEGPSSTLVVADADGRVVGFGLLDCDGGEVEAVFVDPEWAGRGIGSSLLDDLERRLDALGFDEARLRAVRNAVGFYERKGYDRVEEVTTETTAGVEMQSVWMEKEL